MFADDNFVLDSFPVVSNSPRTQRQNATSGVQHENNYAQNPKVIKKSKNKLNINACSL